MEHVNEHGGHSAPASTTYNINLQVGNAPLAGEEVELSLIVTEQKVAEPIETFEVLHERLMHLIIVDESLSYFAHIHPVLERGGFRILHRFPREGRYKAWAEVKPAGAESVLAAFRLTVAPGSRAVNTGDFSIRSDYRVTLSPSDRAALHEPVELAFDVADSSGNPVTDLEPLMGAGGHCVIISSDLRDFVHVHPVQEVDSTWRGGPRIRFIASFHRPVAHKVWAQFQHRREIITASFDMAVQADAHY